MPRLIPSRLAVACALALTLVVAVAVSAPAEVAVAPRQVPAKLRVIGSHGKVLAEETLRTARFTSVPTSPKAMCLGAGAGGSGKPAKVVGATALGLLGQAAKSKHSLRPLLITDHFSFGLGLCGVGGSVGSAKSGLSWYLKVNHVDPERGGDSVPLRAGDEVLWALAPYPYPSELSLKAPGTAHPGKPFEVTVFAYNDKGKKSPAQGAVVTGATEPTDANGHAAVTLTKERVLIARRGADIPSNKRRVSMCLPDGTCPVLVP